MFGKISPPTPCLERGKPLKRLGMGSGRFLPTIKIVGYIWKISAINS